MNKKDYFNMMAEKWDEICYHEPAKLQYIMQKINPQKGDKVLDVGTGTGVLIPYILPYIGDKGEVVAVDFSEKMIEQAYRKHKYENVKFICADIIEVSLLYEYFDIAICYSVFPHFEDKRVVIAKIANLLKNDGKLVICHSQGRNTINNLHKNLPSPVSADFLPDVDTMKDYLVKANIEPTITIDNEEVYIIMGYKHN
ncbi:class I SAM-dependent DNA methyltransferase [Thermoanaerobacter kivui]|nr:class I SAM-dependent methyltransferase [Thermoanaerobacter kivui]